MQRSYYTLYGKVGNSTSTRKKHCILISVSQIHLKTISRLRPKSHTSCTLESEDTSGTDVMFTWRYNDITDITEVL